MVDRRSVAPGRIGRSAWCDDLTGGSSPSQRGLPPAMVAPALVPCTPQLGDYA